VVVCVDGVRLASGVVRYSKALVAVLAAVVSAVVARWTSGAALDLTGWTNVAVAGAGALSVFIAPNIASSPATKAAIASVSALLTIVVTTIGPTVASSAWWQVAVAVAGALGVYGIRNTGGIGVAP
jgi:hypothetical protein